MTPVPASETILVTDGDQRSALAIVRSLGRAGYVVHVTSPDGASLSGASRFATTDHTVADALHTPAQFVDDIQRIVRETGTTLIIPTTEPALLALLPVRDRFVSARIPFASADAFSRISDKAAVLQAANAVGIAIPAQHVLHDPASLTPDVLDRLHFPIVIKPARSVSDGTSGRIKLSVIHAANRGELTRAVAEIDSGAYPLLLQQRIVGPGIGVFLLLWEGETIATFSHRRIRERPPAGGVSVYRESTPLDPELVSRSRALLQMFEWNGVAMVEFKVDARTNVPYLMEINGRFWGSLQLAIDAGVDFPRLLVEAALGRSPAPVTTYDADVRSRWFFGDLDHLLLRLARSDETLALPPGAPGKFATLRAFLRRDQRDRDEIRHADDPGPFRRERSAYIAHLLRR